MNARVLSAIIVGLVVACPSTYANSIIFIEDFSGDLAKWTGKAGGAHHGAIVADPLNPRK